MDPLDNLEERVAMFLGQLDCADAHQPRGVSTLDVAGVPVLVSCFLLDGHTFCRVTAVVLREVAPSLVTLHELLARGRQALLGAFQLFDDGSVVYAVTLMGHSLDHDGFALAVRHAADVARTEGPRLRRTLQADRGAPTLRREDATETAESG